MGIGDNTQSNLSINNTSCSNAYHKRENSINIKIEGDISKSKIRNTKNYNNRDKGDVTNLRENKKIKNKKIHGKTNLIMSVVNDNLLGNFNYTEFINQNFSKIYNKSFKN